MRMMSYKPNVQLSIEHPSSQEHHLKGHRNVAESHREGTEPWGAIREI